MRTPHAVAGVLTLAAALGAAGTAPQHAHARSYFTTFGFVQVAPSRVWQQTAWIPQSIDVPPGVQHRFRLGADTYRGIWVPAAVSRTDTTLMLGYARRDARIRVDGSMFFVADRELTAAERRVFRVFADLYRDADVMVLRAGHPACAGLTRAQARAIASGRITRWSQVVAGAPADRIAVRYPEVAGTIELRFGARLVGATVHWRATYAPGARGAADGGVAEAARNPAVAAITSWTAMRRQARTDVCVVPLGGVAPSDAAVAALTYPAAFPVRYVVPRSTRGVAPRDLITRREVRRHLASDAFRATLRGTGVLVSGDPIAPPQPVPPGLDPQDPPAPTS
ncbi:MAG: hypothetical protein U0237_14450 [Thermoleophilia bacterium]